MLLIEWTYVVVVKCLPKRRRNVTYVTATYVKTKIIHMRGESARDTFTYGLAEYVYTYKGIKHKVYATDDVRGHGKTFCQKLPYSFDSSSFPDTIDVKVSKRTGRVVR